ncbi:hypothetical protein AEAC466_08415 [Asticcacaulis sp. AC466]|uniref:DUF2155 domain-containing protein n=1 Tax=Asticcacaulis sp. AC466 TaxID=1282362 RepID=UPI0003C3F032|nr:DUF2155 domain-containing protein [Asticcacaulis sp. AC466]ESQ84368.1 hypothetical protein AEAC466_08415 [Asticcacaulis sp. AC466]
MKRISVSGWALLAAVVACVVIPASAQVPPPDHSDAPHYVDSADYDPQPYYVDGVQYKPYVPEKKKAKPAADTVKAAASPATPETVAKPGELHPFVPQAAPNQIASSDAAPKNAASSSSSSQSVYVPQKRPRYAVAIIEALDKVTAESVRFEAPLGKPIRYKGLIYTVKACETTAEDEAVSDVMAYVRVRTNPVSATSNAPATKSKEVFRGWTFSSTPSLNPIQHPVYDAWVIGCRKPLSGTAS